MESYTFDRGIYYIIIGWVLTLILMVVVGIRLYSRGILTRSIGSDDFAITIAAILSIDGIIQDTLCVKAGLGRHESLLTPDEIAQVNKWSDIDWLIVFISFFFVRASVMLFVLRLLPPGKKWATRIIFVTFFLNFAITMVATVSYGLKCIPYQAAWEKTPGAKCLSNNIITITQQVNGVLACLIDITTALIPQFLLWDLKMKRSTKISLDIIFALGLITAGLSIGRVATMNAGVWSTDTSWRGMNSDTFSMVEEKCGIIFASGPALRQFFAYRRRVGTVAPTKDRQEPEEDFHRFRKRINLRDIFWYRQAALSDGRVTRPQRLFYPSDPPTNASDKSNLSNEKAHQEAHERGKRSMLDVLKGKAAHPARPAKSQDKGTPDSSQTGRTRLYDWSTNDSTKFDATETQTSEERLYNHQQSTTDSEPSRHASRDYELAHDLEAAPQIPVSVLHRPPPPVIRRDDSIEFRPSYARLGQPEQRRYDYM